MDRRGQFREALARLGQVQKPGRGAAPYSRWVNRGLGRVWAALAYSLGLRPNTVTLVSATFTFSALILVMTIEPDARLGFLVTALLLVGYSLDAADGQLARLTGGGSIAGEFLDHFVDAVKVNVFHIAILVSLYRFGDAPTWSLANAVAFQALSALMFFGLIFMGLLRTVSGQPSRGSDRSSRLQSIAVIPQDYGLLCMVFLLIGWPELFRVAYAVLFAVNLLLLVGALAKWWREVRALDVARLATDQSTAA